MPIGADGRIIRRGVRYFTPVNTNQPSERTGFFLGLISVMIIPVLVILVFMLIGWLGGMIFSLSWWNYRNFFIAGFLVNLLIFPIYIAGVLEGLARVNFSRYRFYAFVYGTLAMGLLMLLNAWSKADYNYWNYLWAGAYGIYSVWLATKMAK